MKGLVVGKGVADQADCPGIPFTLTVPDQDPQNLAILGRNLTRWQQRRDYFYDEVAKKRLPLDTAKRADFAVDVMRTMIGFLSSGIMSMVFAVDPDGDILGVGQWQVIPSDLFTSEITGLVALVAIDPVNVPGSPFNVQLRGTGTALVASMAAQMLKAGVTTVWLSPLDSEADRFWRGRGFSSCGFHILCIRGAAQIHKLVEACKVAEQPMSGEYVCCGMDPKIRERLRTR